MIHRSTGDRSITVDILILDRLAKERDWCARTKDMDQVTRARVYLLDHATNEIVATEDVRWKPRGGGGTWRTPLSTITRIGTDRKLGAKIMERRAAYELAVKTSEDAGKEGKAIIKPNREDYDITVDEGTTLLMQDLGVLYDIYAVALING